MKSIKYFSKVTDEVCKDFCKETYLIQIFPMAHHFLSVCLGMVCNQQ